MATSLPRSLLNLEPKPASYLSAARQIASESGDELRQVRVSILSSFTAEVLRPYLVVEGALRGLRIVPHFCPFNQVEIQALTPTSELYQSQPDVIVVALRLEEIAPNLVSRYVGLSPADVEVELANLQERLQGLLNGIRQQSTATILLWNFAMPVILDAGIADAGLKTPQRAAIDRANAAVAAACHPHAAAHVFDYAGLVAAYGQARWYDPKLFHTARIPFSLEGQMGLGRRLARYVRAVLVPPCKCLVVDLDNTLWGGVLGEEGLGGIALGEDYPGNVYKHFQRRLLSLRAQGILLAVASKNNEADVLEALERHPDMLLRPPDFAAFQIHWGDKATSLQRIATELNIGVDALAFFDDSPVERAWVQQHLPAVTVIDVPSDPLQYMNALEESGAFDRLTISDDDRRRADMIHEARQRQQLQTQVGSVEDFLRDLAMTATIGALGPATLPRVAQLIAKTNQFNLTTRRYTEAQLQALTEQQGGLALWMRLRDRFGDSGLIGVAIGIAEGSAQWRVDTFLMSCRVIGRQAETALLGALVQQVSARGGKTLIGEYVPTAKNGQVVDFYRSHGFRALHDAGRRWILDLTSTRIASPGFIRVEHAEAERCCVG